VNFLGIGLMYGIAVVGATLAIAMIAKGTTEAMARQPEVAGKVQTIFFVGAGMAEALGILGFVMAILLWTKIV
jgi:F-type H+-transporting ATPase subunit c